MSATAVKDELWYLTDRERRDDAGMRAQMAKHVATYRTVGEGADRLELLTWGRPDTGACRIHYTTHGSRLYIAGDIGSAVYNRASGVAWWASLYPNFQYFTEKCEASDTGRHAREYEPDAVREGVRDYFADLARDRSPRLKERRRTWKEMDGERAVDSEHEWTEWRRAHGYQTFGGDWWEVAPDGMVVSRRARFHLLGLHLAVAQIAAASTPEPAP